MVFRCGGLHSLAQVARTTQCRKKGRNKGGNQIRTQINIVLVVLCLLKKRGVTHLSSKLSINPNQDTLD